MSMSNIFQGLCQFFVHVPNVVKNHVFKRKTLLDTLDCFLSF